MAKQFTDDELENMELEERVKLGEFRIWGKTLFNIDEAMPNDIIMFNNIGGKYYPTSPYPMSFMITKDLSTQDMFCIKRLTMSQLFIHTLKTSITSFLFTLKFTAYKLGFIRDIPYADRLSWSDFTPWANKELKHRYALFNFKSMDHFNMSNQLESLSEQINNGTIDTSEVEDGEDDEETNYPTWIGSF